MPNIIPRPQSSGMPKGPRREGKLPWCNDYSDDVALRIAEEVADGRSLKEICETEPWAPSPFCVQEWQYVRPEFRELLHMARRQFAGQLVADALQDALGSDDPALRVKTRLWAAERLDPDVWGKTRKIEATLEQTASVTISDQRDEIDLSGYSLDEIKLFEDMLKRRRPARVIDGEAINDA